MKLPAPSSIKTMYPFETNIFILNEKKEILKI
jgi:hypothetical protein